MITQNEMIKSIAIPLKKYDHYNCNNVFEAFQCNVTYIMKYSSAFTMLSMISLCVIVASHYSIITFKFCKNEKLLSHKTFILKKITKPFDKFSDTIFAKINEVWEILSGDTNFPF